MFNYLSADEQSETCSMSVMFEIPWHFIEQREESSFSVFSDTLTCIFNKEIQVLGLCTERCEYFDVTMISKFDGVVY